MDKKETKKVTAHNKKIFESREFLEFANHELTGLLVESMKENKHLSKEVSLYRKFVFAYIVMLGIGIIAAFFI